MMTDWSSEDKKELYEALKMYGSKNIEAICKKMSNKDYNEVKTAIEEYRAAAIEKFSAPNTRIKTSSTGNSPDVTLESYIRVLTESFNPEELQNELPKAVRILAEYEKIHNPSLTNCVDFQKIYEAIATVLEGKPLPDLNLDEKCVLRKGLLETFEDSKKFLSVMDFKTATQDMTNPVESVCPRVTCSNNSEQKYLEEIATEKHINPFGLSVDYLKCDKIHDKKNSLKNIIK